jgi:riboflavin kinase/FMN adenylyltransferase
MGNQLINIQGIVVHGFGRGRELGFPTANMDIDSDSTFPEHGVWAAKVLVEGKEYMALANIGFAKTFNAEKATVEPYILDFDEDIYGETIELILHKYLRGMIKFENQEALIEQRGKDCEEIREYFKKS